MTPLSPSKITEEQHLFDSSPLPAEAFVYNAAAELIRSGARTTSVHLTRQIYRRVASVKSLRRLFADLEREFGNAALRLTVGTEKRIGPRTEFEYYINFTLQSS